MTTDREKLQAVWRILDEWDDSWSYASEKDQLHADIAKAVGWKAETAEDIQALWEAGEKLVTKRPNKLFGKLKGFYGAKYYILGQLFYRITVEGDVLIKATIPDRLYRVWAVGPYSITKELPK